MDVLNTIIKLKLEQITLPAFIALSIINERGGSQEPTMYIGETHGYYQTRAKTLGYPASFWTYSAVARMLNVLTSRGLLTKTKHGRYNAYGISAAGRATINRINGIELKPVTKVA